MFGLFKYPHCLVSFDGRKDYHYRAPSDKIQVGSQVIVPVGKYDAWKIGTVLSVTTYSRFKVPYPLGKTKFVVELAGKNAEQKVEKHNKKLMKQLQREQKCRIEENKRNQDLAWIDAMEAWDALFND